MSIIEWERIHTGDVDNKHNVNNYRYQIIGGYFILTIGHLVVDTDLLWKSGVSAYLIKIKDFASDNLVEDICSYETLKKLSDGVKNGATERLI